MKTTKNGTGGVAIAESETLRYNSCDPDSITDIVTGRTIWRGESINPDDVTDRYDIDDDQKKQVNQFLAEIRKINTTAKLERAEKIRIENEKHATIPSRGVGYCEKCGSYCFGDCEAN